MSLRSRFNFGNCGHKAKQYIRISFWISGTDFLFPLPEGWIRLWRRRRSIPQLQRCSFASCKKGATPFRFFSKPVPLSTLSFLFFPTQFPSTKTKKDAVAIGAKLKVHFFIWDKILTRPSDFRLPSSIFHLPSSIFFRIFAPTKIPQCQSHGFQN